MFLIARIIYEYRTIEISHQSTGQICAIMIIDIGAEHLRRIGAVLVASISSDTACIQGKPECLEYLSPGDACGMNMDYVTIAIVKMDQRTSRMLIRGLIFRQREIEYLILDLHQKI